MRGPPLFSLLPLPLSQFSLLCWVWIPSVGFGVLGLCLLSSPRESEEFYALDRNAGVIRGVIHPTTLFRVPRVRLRREEEDAVQRGMSAPRELPKDKRVGLLGGKGQQHSFRLIVNWQW